MLETVFHKLMWELFQSFLSKNFINSFSSSGAADAGELCSSRKSEWNLFWLQTNETGWNYETLMNVFPTWVRGLNMRDHCSVKFLK